MKGIEKVVSEIAKTKTKISEYQTRLRELERQKMDMENAEIVSLIRGANIAPEEIQAVIEAFKKKAGGPSAPARREESENEE